MRLFIDALRSPAGKGRTSWLSFVMSNYEVVTFLLVSWVRCGARLYRFLIFALFLTLKVFLVGAQWLSGRVLTSRPKGRGFEPHRRHCVVSLSKNINPSLVLVQPRKTRPFITERLLMGRKESNQTNQTKVFLISYDKKNITYMLSYY